MKLTDWHEIYFSIDWFKDIVKKFFFSELYSFLLLGYMSLSFQPLEKHLFQASMHPKRKLHSKEEFSLVVLHFPCGSLLISSVFVENNH